MAEIHARRFVQARLYTPSAHVRARRFFERRGWSTHGELWNAERQLVLTEYRLTLVADRREPA